MDFLPANNEEEYGSSVSPRSDVSLIVDGKVLKLLLKRNLLVDQRLGTESYVNFPSRVPYLIAGS